ncbi:E3 ubiquitin-protein ligase XIAP [Biomphalaria pfeifferi]|uniref:E3 ubiquitin-protein ligase XIAP n=1 Tax=Biomphalaria pfeifferi TaxID=112525 RepID=A0AAD8AW99_BIOPF|nr:E3 ubiquitin-protein ligase XIAP [Biomphalaria pfeifferi]
MSIRFNRSGEEILAEHSLSDTLTIAHSDTPAIDDTNVIAVSEATVIPAMDTVSANTFIDTPKIDVDVTPVSAARGTPVNSHSFSCTQIIPNLISGTHVEANTTFGTPVAATLTSDTTYAIVCDQDVHKTPNIFTSTPNIVGAVKDTDVVSKASGSQHFLPPEDGPTAAKNISITNDLSSGVYKPAPCPKDSDTTPTELYDVGPIPDPNGNIADVNPYGINLKKGQDMELDNRAPTHAELNITTALPKYAEYANSSERNKSFQNSPKNIYENRKSLCKAGFLYTGPLLSALEVTESQKRHGVVCFYCGLGLKDPSTDVWSQHRTLAPNCPYVLLHKGTADVENTSCHGPKEEKQDTKTGTSSYNQVLTPALEEDVAVKLLVQKGYVLQKVLEAADQLKQKGKTFTVDDLQLRLDPEKARSQFGQSDEYRKLKEEIVLMRKIHICQTCQENPVQVVFLPCGHFLSCVDCAIIEGLIKNACKACEKPVIAWPINFHKKSMPWCWFQPFSVRGDSGDTSTVVEEYTLG